MATVTVLGGSGAVGRVAVETLARHELVDRVVIADIDTTTATRIAEARGAGKVTVRPMDARDTASIQAAIQGADVVVNCVGPFFEHEERVLGAVIDAGIDYVDVCDDVDATYAALAMDERAKAKGVTACLGMGNSPGITNVLARLACEVLLDEAHAIDIYHAHGGEPHEGEGVIGHRFHCMEMPIPMFLDGELRTVSFHEPEGVALREEVDFYRLGEGITVYPYPHPEQITLPRYFDVRQVTNRGTVLPAEYYDLTMAMSKAGLGSREPLDVRGQEVVPYDFAVAWILRERERILRETAFGNQRGCAKVVVSGTRRGEPRSYVFSIASESQALGEGTGIPAAMGALLMLRGKIQGPGVIPPEGCVNPFDLVALIPEVMELGGPGGAGFEGIVVDQIDADGTVTRVDTAQFFG